MAPLPLPHGIPSLSLASVQAFVGSALPRAAHNAGGEGGGGSDDEGEEEDEENQAAMAEEVLRRLGAEGGGAGERAARARARKGKKSKLAPLGRGAEDKVVGYWRFEQPSADLGRRRGGAGGGGAVKGVRLNGQDDIVVRDVSPQEHHGALLRLPDAVSGAIRPDKEVLKDPARGSFAPSEAAPFEIGDGNKVPQARVVLLGLAAVRKGKPSGGGAGSGSGDDDFSSSSSASHGDAKLAMDALQTLASESLRRARAVLSMATGGKGRGLVPAAAIPGTCIAIPVSARGYLDVGTRPADRVTASWTLELWVRVYDGTAEPLAAGAGGASSSGSSSGTPGGKRAGGGGDDGDEGGGGGAEARPRMNVRLGRARSLVRRLEPLVDLVPIANTSSTSSTSTSTPAVPAPLTSSKLRPAPVPTAATPVPQGPTTKQLRGLRTQWELSVTDKGALQFSSSADVEPAQTVVSETGLVPPDTWVHVAVVVEGLSAMGDGAAGGAGGGGGRGADALALSRIPVKLFVDARQVGAGHVKKGAVLTEPDDLPEELAIASGGAMLVGPAADIATTEMRVWAAVRSARDIDDAREFNLDLAEAKNRRWKVQIASGGDEEKEEAGGAAGASSSSSSAGAASAGGFGAPPPAASKGGLFGAPPPAASKAGGGGGLFGAPPPGASKASK
jgi:hypothetical protein